MQESQKQASVQVATMENLMNSLSVTCYRDLSTVKDTLEATSEPVTSHKPSKDTWLELVQWVVSSLVPLPCIFALACKIRNIITLFASTSESTPLNLLIKCVNDELTGIHWEYIFEENCRGYHGEWLTEILLTQINVPNVREITTQMKGGWKIWKTHILWRTTRSVLLQNKVRFTSIILLTKTNMPLCFIVDGNELKKRWNCSWHDFTSSHTNEQDFWIVLYCTIYYDTKHMTGIFWVLHVGNFVGVSFGSLLARIANNSLKQVWTGGIPHSLVTLGLCYVTFQPISMCISLKNAESAKGFVSKQSAFWSSVGQ